MPSNALNDFQVRLAEVRQLLDAHGALTRLKNAQATLNSGGQSLNNVAQVIQQLVSAPRRGRPPEVQALNSAGIALLSAHLQGFVVDIFTEVATTTLTGKVRDLAAVIGSANTHGNPNEQNINRLFNSIGYPNILDGISWQRTNNRRLLAKLKSFNELRNRIVHGRSETVRKSTLENYLATFTTFADRLDQKLFNEVRAVIGSNPW